MLNSTAALGRPPSPAICSRLRRPTANGRMACSAGELSMFSRPSFQLLAKVREGAKVKKTYRPPATPCARLLAHAAVSERIKGALRSQEAELDPLKLLKQIRDSQAALAALSSG